MVLAGLVVLSSICFAMNGNPHIHRELWILESKMEYLIKVSIKVKYRFDYL